MGLNKNICLFIVDDDVVSNAILKKYFKKENFNWVKFFSAKEEFLVQLEKNHPDLIILDAKLKTETEGLELAEFVDRTYNLPIIIPSGYPRQMLLAKNCWLNKYLFRKAYSF